MALTFSARRWLFFMMIMEKDLNECNCGRIAPGCWNEYSMILTWARRATRIMFHMGVRRADVEDNFEARSGDELSLFFEPPYFSTDTTSLSTTRSIWISGRDSSRQTKTAREYESNRHRFSHWTINTSSSSSYRYITTPSDASIVSLLVGRQKRQHHLHNCVVLFPPTHLFLLFIYKAPQTKSK